ASSIETFPDATAVISAIAPGGLSAPCPCVRGSAASSGRAVYSSTSLIVCGEGVYPPAVRAASITSAATPLVTAADLLVPLSRKSRATPPFPVSCQFGYWAKSELPTAAVETSWWPGATRSGFTSPSYHVGPRELYGATMSSPRVAVPRVSSAPTVIADGALPGLRIPAYPGSPVKMFLPTL